MEQLIRDAGLKPKKTDMVAITKALKEVPPDYRVRVVRGVCEALLDDVNSDAFPVGAVQAAVASADFDELIMCIAVLPGMKEKSMKDKRVQLQELANDILEALSIRDASVPRPQKSPPARPAEAPDDRSERRARAQKFCPQCGLTVVQCARDGCPVPVAAADPDSESDPTVSCRRAPSSRRRSSNGR